MVNREKFIQELEELKEAYNKMIELYIETGNMVYKTVSKDIQQELKHRGEE